MIIRKDVKEAVVAYFKVFCLVRKPRDTAVRTAGVLVEILKNSMHFVIFTNLFVIIYKESTFRDTQLQKNSIHLCGILRIYKQQAN